MKIFLTFIFKNESKVLLRMLTSVNPIIDGCICTDTGSTDDSKSIIKDFFERVGKPCTILDYPTEKYGTDMHFGNWRNHALPELKGKCDMVFWIDSKEELIFSQGFNIQEFKDSLAGEDIANIIINTNGSHSSRSSFFNNKKRFHWIDPLHELLKCLDYAGSVKDVLAKDLYVERRLDGFTWTSQTQIQKYIAHAEFLERYIAKKKYSSRNVFYCAQSWRDAKEFKKALKWYRKRAGIVDKWKEERYYAQYEVGNMCSEIGEPVNKCIKEYLKCSAIHELRAEHLFSIIELLQKDGRWKESLEYSQKAVDKYHGKNPYPTCVLFLDNEIYEYKLMDAHKLNLTMIETLNRPIAINPADGSLNVIWQTPAGEVTTFELEYIQKVLLSKTQYTPYFDSETFRTILNNSLIIYSNDTPDISPSFRAYLKKFDELGHTYYLLHLSNEKLNHNCDYYKNAKHVFRGYYDSSLQHDNVTFLPIGFKSGFLNATDTINSIQNRNGYWAFIGQIKSERKLMYDSLIDIKPHFTHLTNYWNCPTALTVSQVIDIYNQTIFIPCPNGWSGVDGGGFRIMEALEWGCIPIIKYNNNSELYKIIYGEHPFIVTESWETAHQPIMDLINNPENLQAKLSEVHAWYKGFKSSLADKFSHLTLRNYPSSFQVKSQVKPTQFDTTSTDNKRVCIVVPYRNRAEHLAKFIPHMTEFLTKKGLEYNIIVVEQEEGKPFNRAKLLNIGFHYTGGAFSNYCFHDVDMLPLPDADYSHCDNPTHLSSRVEQFNWNLPFIKGMGFYYDYFGGVTLFDRESFLKINGYSNDYWGWGCEDDDCRQRTLLKGIEISRRNCSFSSLSHASNSTSPEYSKNYIRYCSLFVDGKFTTSGEDGLVNLKYDTLEVKSNSDYTHIKVSI